jgi:hypothetical protein
MFLKLPIYLKPLVLLGVYFILYVLTVFFINSILLTASIIVEISAAFALVWTLMLVGFFFYQTYKRVYLPKKYYSPKRYENARFYERLGIVFFQYCLVNSFFRYMNPRVYLKQKGRQYLEFFYNETKQSETSHIISGLVTLFVQILLFYWLEYIAAISLTIFTVIFNLYPFFLQRYNRLKLNRLFDK